MDGSGAAGQPLQGPPARQVDLGALVDQLGPSSAAAFHMLPCSTNFRGDGVVVALQGNGSEASVHIKFEKNDLRCLSLAIAKLEKI